jgi:hypothetical protein
LRVNRIHATAEQISESAARSRVFDDFGNAHEVFLWNGKQVSKKKFMERLAPVHERQMPRGGQESPSCSLPGPSAEGGVTFMNEAEPEPIEQEPIEIEPEYIRMLRDIELVNGAKLEAEKGAMSELLAAMRHVLRIEPGLKAKVAQDFRTAGFSVQLIARHFGGDSQDRKRKKSKRP